MKNVQLLLINITSGDTLFFLAEYSPSIFINSFSQSTHPATDQEKLPQPVLPYSSCGNGYQYRYHQGLLTPGTWQREAAAAAWPRLSLLLHVCADQLLIIAYKCPWLLLFSGVMTREKKVRKTKCAYTISFSANSPSLANGKLPEHTLRMLEKKNLYLLFRL